MIDCYKHGVSPPIIDVHWAEMVQNRLMVCLCICIEVEMECGAEISIGTIFDHPNQIP